MIVTVVEEHEDGSASVTLDDISSEELRMLVQAGLVALLKEYIEKEDKNAKVAALLKEKP